MTPRHRHQAWPTIKKSRAEVIQQAAATSLRSHNHRRIGAKGGEGMAIQCWACRLLELVGRLARLLPRVLRPEDVLRHILEQAPAWSEHAGWDLGITWVPQRETPGGHKRPSAPKSMCRAEKNLARACASTIRDPTEYAAIAAARVKHPPHVHTRVRVAHGHVHVERKRCSSVAGEGRQAIATPTDICLLRHTHHGKTPWAV